MDLLEPQATRWSWGRIFHNRAGDEGRDRFLAGLFGLFCEDVVRFWCRCGRARYQDLGRATLWERDGSCYSTLDFTLRDRVNRRVYVADMRTWLAAAGAGFAELTDPTVLRARALESMAFHRFLTFAADPSAYRANVTPQGWSKPVEPQGAVLIWGSLPPAVRERTMAEYGLADVLSVDDMLHDIHAGAGNPPDPSAPAGEQWREHIQRLHTWSDELYAFLARS